jgi:hypothetical protein
VLEVIACLDWIPAQVLPVFGWFLPLRLEGYWAGVERELKLTTEIKVVDEVVSTFRSQEGDCTAVLEIDA